MTLMELMSGMSCDSSGPQSQGSGSVTGYRSGYGTIQGCGDQQYGAPLAVPLLVVPSSRDKEAELGTVSSSECQSRYPLQQCHVRPCGRALISARSASPR